MTASTRQEKPPWYAAVVFGGSAGGTEAMAVALASLPADYPLPVLAVEHVHETDDGMLADRLARSTALRVIVPCDKQPIEPGCLYVAPANYHMLVERNGTIALSVDERVKWSRPSIDVLFESAALAWGPRLVAVLWSGANNDGAEGLLAVKKRGGLTIAQDPVSAQYPVMPQAAISAGAAGEVLSPEKVGTVLVQVGTMRTASPRMKPGSPSNPVFEFAHHDLANNVSGRRSP